MPESLTDLTGLGVAAEDFLAAVLETAAQPFWVADAEGVIRFANQAAIAALGYERAAELLGRRSHETIHHGRADETVAGDLEWFCRRDGSIFPVSYVAAPIDLESGRGAVVTFTDIEDRLRAERELRGRDAALASQQASLRRIAALVAGGAGSAEVFAAIAREVARVLGVPLVALLRHESDGTGTVIGVWSKQRHPFQAGSRWPQDRMTIAARESGLSSATTAPIVVDGAVWGVMTAGGTEREPLPDDIEDQLVDFAELVATAVANSASREQSARLADEQAALRRVATLVARESPPAEIFAAVAEEVGRLLRVEDTTIFRYEDDWTATVVADRGDRDIPLPIGSRLALDGESATALVRRTGLPARMDDFSNATGPLADYTRDAGIGSTVGSPIVVDGRLWGAMIAATRSDEPMPAATESRIGQFTELVATAISNIQARSDLAASRARIAAAADEERRRVVRDLHDGAQQRLIHTAVTLELARQALQDHDETGPALVNEALTHTQDAIAELRELALGILPGVLTRGGLRAGVESLAARMTVPIECDVCVDRLAPAVEATAYFVVAESLTNIAKHARAKRATVLARVEDGSLRVQVRDDGVGGAQPDGHGLLGLADRLDVLDGRLVVESPADGGTLIAAEIPLPG